MGISRFPASLFAPVFIIGVFTSNTTVLFTVSTISKVYDTPYIEDWAGKYISIYIARVKAFGETVEALRIRNRVPTAEKIYCEDCKKEIAVVSGKTAEEIADIAVRNCGRRLCVDCMKIEKEKMNAEDGTDGKQTDSAGAPGGRH